MKFLEWSGVVLWVIISVAYASFVWFWIIDPIWNGVRQTIRAIVVRNRCRIQGDDSLLSVLDIIKSIFCLGYGMNDLQYGSVVIPYDRHKRLHRKTWY